MTARHCVPPFAALHATAATCGLVGALLAIACLTSGCHEHGKGDQTLLEHLHWLCFSGSVDCEQLELDALLYLDTVNLPSNNGDRQFVVLSSLPTTPIADGNDRLGFSFDESERLPAEIDPGILDQLGWKVRLTSARLKYCDTCNTNVGLAKVIDSYGSLGNAEFIYDPADTLEIYVRTKVIP